MKQGFKRSLCWNKYSSEKKKSEKVTLVYMIDRTMRIINKLSVLWIKNDNNDKYCNKYYMKLLGIKGFSASIAN